MTTAEDFWKHVDMKKLAEYWNYQKRLSYDVQKLIPHIRHYQNIADVGCGNAQITTAIDHILHFDSIFLTDINEYNLFKTLIGLDLRYGGQACNINNFIPQEVYNAECVLLLGVIIYIIDNVRLKEILSSLKSVIIRVPCYKEQIYINKYSEELEANYEALYRTKDDIISILHSIFNIVKCEKIYPKNLETHKRCTTYLFVGRNT